MSYRLIVSDIDGTLLNDKNRLLPSTEKTLLDLAKTGVLFATASARTKSNTLNVIPAFKEVCCANAYTNGTLVETKDGQVLMDSPMERGSVAFLIDQCKEHRASFCCISQDVARAKIYHPECTKPFSMYNGGYSEIDNGYPSEARVYFMAVFAENLKPFGTAIEKSQPDIEFSPIGASYLEGLDFCFLQKAGANKKTALYAIAEHYHVDLTKTVAMGDGHWNDGPMIKAAGWGIAMRNANPILYKEADFITEKGNNEDGAGEYLRNLFNL